MQRYGFASAPISNGGYMSISLCLPVYRKATGSIWKKCSDRSTGIWNPTRSEICRTQMFRNRTPSEIDRDQKYRNPTRLRLAELRSSQTGRV